MKIKYLAIETSSRWERKPLTYSRSLLKGGVHLIFGPNGSGKTTTCFAVRRLLWPAGEEDSSLRSVWESGGQEVTIECRGETRSVRPSASLSLPPARFAGCYIITAEELFSAEDRQFAEEVMRALCGGFSLQAMRQQPAFFLPKRGAYKEERDLREAKSALQAVYLEQEQLQQQWETIDTLREEIEEAKQAELVALFWERVLEWRECEATIESLKGELTGYPEAIASLSGEEGRQLATLQKKREQLARALQQVKTQQRELQALLSEGKPLQLTEISVQEKRLHKLRQLDAEYETARRHLEPLREKVRLRGESLGIKAPLSLEQLSSIEKAWEPLQRALQQEQMLPQQASLWHGCLIAFSLSAQVLLLSFAPSFLTGIATFFGVALLFNWLQQRHGAQHRELAQRKKQTKEQLLTLYPGLLVPEGVQVGEQFVQWLLAYHTEYMELQVEEKRVTQILEERETVLDGINAWLSSHTFSPAEDLSTAESMLDVLRESQMKREAREGECALLTVQQKQLEIQVVSLQEEEAQFLALIGTEALLQQLLDTLPEYRKKRERAEEQEAASRALQKQLKLTPQEAEAVRLLPLSLLEEEKAERKAQASLYESLLKDKVESEHAVQRAKKSDLLMRAKKQEALAQQALEKRREEIAQIAARNVLLSLAEEQFREQNQPELFQLACDWFVRFTRGRYELVSPEVQEAKVHFFARDCLTERLHSLAELSQGTRMQLLFAIRLSFCLAHEKKGEPLPLFFDELFAHSDQMRCQAMAAVIATLAQEGRQLFLFSCRESECALWADLLKKQGVEETTLIDLEQQALVQAPSLPSVQKKIVPPAKNSSLTSYAHALSLPALDPNASCHHTPIFYLLETAEELYHLHSLSIDTYGQLQALAPSQSLDSLVGREGFQKSFVAKGKLLEKFFALRKEGRGAPVTKEILRKAGVSARYLEPLSALSQEVGAQAKEFLAVIEGGNDARTKGFRKKQLMQLKDTLTTEGCLDEREPLSPQEVKVEMQKCSAAQVETGALSRKEVAHFFQNLFTTLETR